MSRHETPQTDAGSAAQDGTAQPDALPLDAYLPYLLHMASAELNAVLLSDLRAYGITVARWRILAVLNDQDGRNIGDLARLTGTEQSAISRVVDQMVRDGLVTRRPAPKDQRIVEVHMTTEGRRVIAKLLPRARERAARAVADFSEQEVATLRGLLHRMLRNLKAPPFY